MQAIAKLPDATRQPLKVEGLKDACRQAWRLGAENLICMNEETWTFTRADLLEIVGLGRAGLLAPYSDTWKAPTSDELKEMMRLMDLSTSKVGRLLGIDPSRVRRWTIIGDEVPYALWRLLSIYAGIVEHNLLQDLDHYQTSR
jgi:hypothetical protein